MAEVVRRYSKALLDLALEENKLPELMDQAKQIKKLLEDQSKFITMLSHPQITTEAKVDLVRNSLSGNVDETMVGFICVIVSKNRGNELLGIIDDFIILSQQKLNITTAYLTSPIEISDAKLAEITDIISKKLGKQITMDFTIDESLLGGIVIKVDGLIFDGSIKKYISDVKKTLGNIILENV